MRILIIHAERFWWRVTESVKIRFKDLLTEDNKEGEGRNILVAFTCIEKTDEAKLDEKCIEAAESIIEVASRVKVNEIIIYPYAHLSENLSKASTALEAIKLISKTLMERGFNVKRSPFGYYKEFMLHCKGHPLSESLRVI